MVSLSRFEAFKDTFILSDSGGESEKLQRIRMHSSKMRTVRCSGRLMGGCLDGECLPRGCTPLPVDRILDTRLSKHYLSETSLADGKNDKYRGKSSLSLPLCEWA